MLTQENIDWVLTKHNAYGKQTLEIEILAKNNQLTEKNLQTYKSGKIKDLFGCQFIMSPSKPEEAVLNARTKSRIHECGQASALLGFNAFDPSINMTTSLEVIDNPITNQMVAYNNTNPLSALLTFSFMLQIFKGAHFFPISFKNAPDPELDPLTKIENNLKAAFKMYRDMDEEMDEEMANEKAAAQGLHRSCFFWRDPREDHPQSGNAISPIPKNNGS